MDAAQRREAILTRLREADAPVSASTLAGDFSVSRQIIVGDVALLRAGGEEISATPRGYVLAREAQGLTRTVAVKHDLAGTRQELYLLVDQGCSVLDVVVEHAVYGQLTGELQLHSRYDVDQFMDRLGREGNKPLSTLTEGIHLHTLRCPDEAAYERARDALRTAGFLLE